MPWRVKFCTLLLAISTLCAPWLPAEASAATIMPRRVALNAGLVMVLCWMLPLSLPSGPLPPAALT
jgi:hypothetical protein